MAALAHQLAFALGMVPAPANLAHTARVWPPAELYWVVKYGIKMTGMPAFGPSHDDQTLWGIAAFVSELPAMTPERYAAFGDTRGERQGSEQTH